MLVQIIFGSDVLLRVHEASQRVIKMTSAVGDTKFGVVNLHEYSKQNSLIEHCVIAVEIMLSDRELLTCSIWDPNRLYVGGFLGDLKNIFKTASDWLRKLRVVGANQDKADFLHFVLSPFKRINTKAIKVYFKK